MKTQADKRCRADAASRHPNCNLATKKASRSWQFEKVGVLYVRAIGGRGVCTVLKVVDSGLILSAWLADGRFRSVGVCK